MSTLTSASPPAAASGDENTVIENGPRVSRSRMIPPSPFVYWGTRKASTAVAMQVRTRTAACFILGQQVRHAAHLHRLEAGPDSEGIKRYSDTPPKGRHTKRGPEPG